jgi:predicted dinucleotide-utilizing enzyme
MLFLIEYDRNEGEVVTIQEFDDSERERAENVRLEMELNLNRLGTEREVVLMEAASEKALRRTHRRYFENLSDLMKAS